MTMEHMDEESLDMIVDAALRSLHNFRTISMQNSSPI
jgi:hypothetical protein